MGADYLLEKFPLFFSRFQTSCIQCQNSQACRVIHQYCVSVVLTSCKDACSVVPFSSSLTSDREPEMQLCVLVLCPFLRGFHGEHGTSRVLMLAVMYWNTRGQQGKISTHETVLPPCLWLSPRQCSDFFLSL